MFHRLSRASLAPLIISFMSLTGTVTWAEDLKVAVSIKPVHSLVSTVMEGAGTPVLLIRGATSPHMFSLRPSDARHISEADLIFLVGEDLESSLFRQVGSLADSANVVHLAEIPGLPLLDFRTDEDFDEHADHGHDDDGHDEHADHGHDDDGHDEHADHGHAHGDFDPHFWTSPVIAQMIASYAAEQLGKKDPANADIYAKNAAELVNRLTELDAEIAMALESVRDHPYVVFHDAYQYFEDQYNLNSVATILLNPEQAPSANRLRAMRERIAATGAVCAFSEPQFPDDIVNVIVEDTPVRTGVLDPLGAFVENGPGLYFTMVRMMASSLRDCLEDS